MPSPIKVFAAHVEVLKADFTAGNVCGCIERTGTVAAFIGGYKRCGYMAGNRSRFSKHLMAGSPIFSINFTKSKDSS